MCVLIPLVSDDLLFNCLFHSFLALKMWVHKITSRALLCLIYGYMLAMNHVDGVIGLMDAVDSASSELMAYIEGSFIDGIPNPTRR